VIDVRLVTAAALPAPDPDTPRLAEALRTAGARVEVADWRDSTIDWSSARVTLLRSPWDYVDHYDEFLAWVQRAGSAGRLWNPPDLVVWNVHKSYLLDLAARGAPVVPTVLLLHGAAAALDAISDAQGWNTVVVKPAVGIGAMGAGRFDVGERRGQEHLDALLTAGDALVQPYLRAIATEGESSVVLVDGVATHAVRKVPALGDFRVHEEWGGRTEAAAASSGLVALAEQVVGVLPVAPLYARVDAVRVGELWHVLEVEVTEPSLWLDLAPPEVTDRLVAAVMARLA